MITSIIVKLINGLVLRLNSQNMSEKELQTYWEDVSNSSFTVQYAIAYKGNEVYGMWIDTF